MGGASATAAAAAAVSPSAPEAGALGEARVHPEGVAPGGAPSFIRKVLGPPAGVEASAAAAAGVGVAAVAGDAAGATAAPEAGGPTGRPSWASAGKIVPSSISPAANAGKIAARCVNGRRGRLVDVPAAPMPDHALAAARVLLFPSPVLRLGKA
jgi:hypothetical protein